MKTIKLLALLLVSSTVNAQGFCTSTLLNCSPQNPNCNTLTCYVTQCKTDNAGKMQCINVVVPTGKVQVQIMENSPGAIQCGGDMVIDGKRRSCQQ